MVWFPTSLHNQNMSEQRILNIFQNSPGRDNLIMGFILLTRRNNSQNLISVTITYGEGMLTPKSDYIIRTKSEYGLSFCLRQIYDGIYRQIFEVPTSTFQVSGSRFRWHSHSLNWQPLSQNVQMHSNSDWHPLLICKSYFYLMGSHPICWSIIIDRIWLQQWICQVNKSGSFIYIISWWWNCFSGLENNSILSKYGKYFCSLCKTIIIIKFWQ